jgi:cytochrome P450
MNRTFVAVSAGGRSCPGKAVAYFELSLTIARTLWYFDFEVAPEKLGRKAVHLGEGDQKSTSSMASLQLPMMDQS